MPHDEPDGGNRESDFDLFTDDSPEGDASDPADDLASPASRTAETRTHANGAARVSRDELRQVYGSSKGHSHGRSTAPRAREKRRNRRILIAALCLLLIPMLTLGGYLLWLNKIVTDNVKTGDFLPNSSVYGGDPPPVGLGQNYLLIGNDAGPDRVGARSDVMILVHVPEDHSRIYMVHFPRDLYVDIPGHGKNKLNAAYAFGGAPLLVRTMEGMLDLKVDHVAVIGFEGFKNMTDAVGGVDVYVAEPSTQSGYVFNVGVNHMDGDRALMFVRQRYELSEGDISRGKRQMAFLQALFEKALSKGTLLNPVSLKNFIEAGSSNLTIDQTWSVADMRSEAFALRGIRPTDIVTLTAPWSGFGMAGSQSIVKMDVARMKDLGTQLRNDTMGNYVP